MFGLENGGWKSPPLSVIGFLSVTEIRAIFVKLRESICMILESKNHPCKISLPNTNH